MKAKFLTIIGFLFLAVSCVENKKEINKEDLTAFDSIAQAKMQIFGGPPHRQQIIETNYRYKLLTSFAYANYVLEPATGNYKAIEAGKTAPLIDLSKQYNIATYLVVTNLGEENNGLFLNNNKAQSTSINILEMLLNQRNANGVIIDFEHIPLKCSDAFSSYIKRMRGQLSKSNKIVLITIPGNITQANSRSFDFDRLNSEVAYYIITYGDLPKDPLNYKMPTAPLFNSELWEFKNLENTIEYYTNGKVPTSKLILSIPYFGNKWDGPKGLSAKFDFVLDKGLGGVYLWGLDNDDSYNELWDVIDEKLWK